jgi:hypothetical protein
VADDPNPAPSGDDKRKAADEAIAKAARLKKEAEDADKLAKSLAKAAGDESPEEPGGGDSDDSAGSESPMGAQVLKAAYDSLSEMTDHLDQAGKVLEHPEVKEYVNSLADELRGHMEKCYGLHKEQYPDEPELTKDMDSADPDNVNNSPPEASGAVKMAKFLARSKSHRLSLKGVAHDLMRLASAKNLKPIQRETVERLTKSLHRISTAAEKGAVEAPTNDALKRLEGLEKAIDGIAKAVENASPHRRV